ncbi:MarR family winged helix-turn-helix transcriptional regulator [Streptomyces sp. NPDC002788]
MAQAAPAGATLPQAGAVPTEDTITREPAEHDRRVVVVHLTDEGRALREPLAVMWRALEEASARNLSAQQAESFVRTACAIADAINSRALPREESE